LSNTIIVSLIDSRKLAGSREVVPDLNHARLGRSRLHIRPGKRRPRKPASAAISRRRPRSCFPDSWTTGTACGNSERTAPSRLRSRNWLLICRWLEQPLRGYDRPEPVHQFTATSSRRRPEYGNQEQHGSGCPFCPYQATVNVTVEAARCWKDDDRTLVVVSSWTDRSRSIAAHLYIDWSQIDRPGLYRLRTPGSGCCLPMIVTRYRYWPASAVPLTTWRESAGTLAGDAGGTGVELEREHAEGRGCLPGCGASSPEHDSE